QPTAGQEGRDSQIDVIGRPACSRTRGATDDLEEVIRRGAWEALGRGRSRGCDWPQDISPGRVGDVDFTLDVVLRSALRRPGKAAAVCPNRQRRLNDSPTRRWDGRTSGILNDLEEAIRCG